MHVLITVVTTILMVVVFYIGIIPLKDTSNGYSYLSTTDREGFIGNAMQVIFILFVCGQIIFPINLFMGLLKKNNDLNKNMRAMKNKA